MKPQLIFAAMAWMLFLAMPISSSAETEADAERSTSEFNAQEDLSEEELMVAELRRLALEAEEMSVADATIPMDLAMTIEELDAMTSLPGQIGPLPTSPPYPENNRPTPERIDLGRKLYFDLRLSGDHSMSCASCHDPSRGWSDALPRSIGFGGRELGRHSPTILNVAFNTAQFWDARADTLEEQAISPILSPHEMNMPSEQHVVDVIRNAPEYTGAFEAAYGEPASIDTITRAIASFERTLVTGMSRFDQYVRGDKSALSEGEKRGLILFVTTGSCTACHNGPNFNDSKCHSLGAPQNGPLQIDEGRIVESGNEVDRYAFKTPGLRNVEMTAPYMHDGSMQTLEEVVDFYAKGGDPTRNRSPLMKPVPLTEQQKADLIAFLKALTGELPQVRIPVGEHFGI